MLRYRLALELDDNGTILVTSPDIPIVSFGDNEAEAYQRAREAVVAILGSMIDAREDIAIPDFEDKDCPPGTPCLVPSLQVQLKVQLYQALQAADLTRADLQRRLGWKRESIDRLFRLEHGSRLEQIEEAFTALGKAVTVNVGNKRVEGERVAA